MNNLIQLTQIQCSLLFVNLKYLSSCGNCRMHYLLDVGFSENGNFSFCNNNSNTMIAGSLRLLGHIVLLRIVSLFFKP